MDYSFREILKIKELKLALSRGLNVIQQIAIKNNYPSIINCS